MQLAAVIKADIVLINEQYRSKRSAEWYPNSSGVIATWVRYGSWLGVLLQDRGDGFV